MRSRAAEIFDVDEVAFVEPSFGALAELWYNEELASGEWDEGRLLLDEHEEPIALAFHGAGVWTLGSFLCRHPSVTLIELFEEVNGKIFQEDRALWAAAVREYFSNALAAEVAPAVDDLNPVRSGIMSGVIERVWGKGSGETCIDCCCGSGVGSIVLRELGYTPLSYDNDPTLLARGLKAGRLLPHETMCLDATKASTYVEPVARGIGCMVGEINTFSQEMWEAIIAELFAVTRETLVTVGTKEEAEIIRGWGQAQGRPVEVQESPGDSFYDHWVCIGRRTD